MSALPRSLSYFLTRMAGYSKNQIQLRAQNQDSARPGDTIVVDLPQGLVDLRTLSMHFDIALTTAGGATNTGVRPPKHAECMIQDILVEAGGILIDSCQNANQLFKILSDYTLGQDRSIARRMLSWGGDVAALTGTANDAASTRTTINNFMGFLGSAKPECIDTSLLPQPLKLYFRMAPLTAYYVAGGTPTVQFNAISFTIDVLDCGPLYTEMLARRLQEGPIEIPYQRWFTFTSGAQGTSQDTRFSVSSQSIDLIMGTTMSADSQTTPQALSAGIASSSYFLRQGVGTSYFMLNNVRFPMYNSTPQTMLNQTLSSFGHLALDTVSGGDALMDTFADYTGGFFVHAIRLNHQDEGVEHSRLVGGFDSRGTAMNGTWSTTGATNGTFPFVYVQCTSVLRVGAARQVEVVQ